MKKLFIEFGDGIRIFHQGHEILKLIFSVDKVFEKIEIINIPVSKEVEIREGMGTKPWEKDGVSKDND